MPKNIIFKSIKSINIIIENFIISPYFASVIQNTIKNHKFLSGKHDYEYVKI